ncbi:MAG: DUF5690 family protein [Nannocystaceae bacterium]
MAASRSTSERAHRSSLRCSATRCRSSSGSRPISEMSGRRRGLAIIALVAVAELALVAFALTPSPWSIAGSSSTACLKG